MKTNRNTNFNKNYKLRKSNKHNWHRNKQGYFPKQFKARCNKKGERHGSQFSFDEFRRRRQRRSSRSSESEDRARFRLDWRRDVRWSGACRCRRRSCDRLRSDFEFLTPEGVDSLRSRRSSCRRAFNGGWCSSCGGRRWRSWTSRSPSSFWIFADGSFDVSLDKTLLTILKKT